MTAVAATISVAVKLFIGTAQAILAKILMDWRDENGNKFGKNYFFQFVLYLSMLTLVLPFFIKECRDYNISRQLSGLKKSHPYSIRHYALALIPGVLDVMALTLSLYTTKDLPVTTSMLLKSLRIVVAALLTKTVMKQSQKVYQWFSVGLTVLGVVPIAMAAQGRADAINDFVAKTTGLENNGSSESVIIPLILVVLCEIFRGVRAVFEEKLMKRDSMSAEFVTFFEAGLGCIVSPFIVLTVHFLPGRDHGSVENFWDTLSRIAGSKTILVLLLLNFFLVGIQNYATTLVSKYLSSVANAVIGQARPLIAWVPNVLLWNMCRNRGLFVEKDVKGYEGKIVTQKTWYGEPIDCFSYLEAIGFIMVSLAALVYSGVIKLPCRSCYELQHRSPPSDDDFTKKHPLHTSSTA